MNSILMVIGALVVILLVFVIFSQDEDEETEHEIIDAEFPQKNGSKNSESGKLVSSSERPLESSGYSLPAPKPQLTPLQPGITPTSPLPNPVGSEIDLKFRLDLEEQLPPPTALFSRTVAVAVVQFRFTEELLNDSLKFLATLAAAEAVIDPKSAPFPYGLFLSNQMDRIWLFGMDEDRDDPIFEALVTLYDAVARFKKSLEGNSILGENKVRIAAGLSFGEVSRVVRGPMGQITHVGRAVYIAETLAESAGDFQIYVDEKVHRLALPLFDFREWKPIKLRSSIPPISFYEVLGWNKKEEIFGYAAHKENYARRAVAVAYRYLDFEELTPLLALLSDSQEDVVLETLKTITEIGDDRALGILKKILPEAAHPRVRGAIIEALGKIGKEDIIPVLLASTKDVNWQVRYCAVKGLFRIAKEAATKHLEHLENDVEGAVKALVHQILYLKTHDEKHLQILEALLTDLSIRARKSAIEALIEIGAPETLVTVTGTYQLQDQDLRRHMLRLLMECKSPVLYQCFLNIFRHANEANRADVVRAVRRAGLVS
ncbi:HEAT repeat domain-containing protein [bacterium]|nr:HEAT repeat domain-containing protein [bacterium]